MNKRSKFLLILSSALLSIYVIAKSIIGTSYELENFPLQEKWSVKLNGEVEGISTADEQIVLVRTNTTLYAVGATEGNILWQHILNWQAVPEPVIVANGFVFFADGKAIWALDKLDGSVVWKQPVSKADSQVKAVSEKIVAVDESQDLNLYDTDNGSMLWSKPVCRNDFQPFLDKTVVYVPCYGLRAIDISSGNNLWEKKETKRFGGVAYDDGVMYFSPDQQSIAAFDLETRSELWVIPLQSSGYTQFEVIEDVLLLTDSDQLCTMRKDGIILWCAENTSPQNPAMIKKTVFIFDGYQKEIIAYDLSSGREIGKLTLVKIKIFSIYRELMISTGNLLIFGSGNEVFAFGE
jgi:outer membrane protein assembly factor BamB